MISPAGGLACWQAISDIQTLARQAVGAFVGVLMRGDPALSRLQAGRLRHRTGPPCHHRRCATPGAWRLGVLAWR